MTHRVSIQYSIELDNLESETERLFAGIQKQIDTLNTSLHPSVPTLSVEAVDKLSDLQDRLQNISIGVDDLQKIIGGYLTFKLQPEETETHEDAPKEAPPPPQLSDEDRHNLREQLSEYRRVLEHAASLQEPDPEIIDEELKRQKIESFKQKQSSSNK